MKTHFHQLFSAVIFATILGGCAAADGRYPSLAVRDAERMQGTLTPSESGTPPVIGITDLDTLTAPLDRAEDAHSRFTAMQGDVARLVESSRGISADSDTKARALAGLAELTSLRGQTALALSDLDHMEVKAATGFKRVQEIRQFQTEILRMIADQDKALDSLKSALDL